MIKRKGAFWTMLKIIGKDSLECSEKRSKLLMTISTLKIFLNRFCHTIFWESLYIWGSQEIKLVQKINVNFFRVDPYTPCNRVSRPFPIWLIWQIWPLWGQKNMFFGGLVKRGNQIWIVLWRFQSFLGHLNDFCKFQKVSKFLTQNSVKKKYR